jgi:hypothetical protein
MTASTTVIQRAPEVCFTQINADEIVILNPDDEQFYHLNASGVDLWLSLETPKPIVTLATVLAEKYHGEPKQYETDVAEWVDDTLNKGLIRVIDQEAVA